MAIAKLTQDNLKEGTREVDQLEKLNEIIEALDGTSGEAISVGNLTAGASVSAGVNQLNGATGFSCTGAGNGGYTTSTGYSGTAVAGSRGAANFVNAGTFDATDTSRSAYGIVSQVTASRSAGANAVINTAVYAVASGGQTNVAIDADNGGDVALAGASDKLGFYGTAPIARQTGVAVDAAGIHAALVALGLITA